MRPLLAAPLVHAGAVVPVDRLTDVLWGDDQPANPDNALQTLVSRLRRLLGDAELLLTRRARIPAVRADEQTAQLRILLVNPTARVHGLGSTSPPGSSWSGRNPATAGADPVGQVYESVLPPSAALGG